MQPDEIYNLGAMSHVKVSFEMSEYTAEADGVGVLRLLNAIRSAGLEKKTRLYQVRGQPATGVSKCSDCRLSRDVLFEVSRRTTCELGGHSNISYTQRVEVALLKSCMFYPPSSHWGLLQGVDKPLVYTRAGPLRFSMYSTLSPESSRERVVRLVFPCLFRSCIWSMTSFTFTFGPVVKFSCLLLFLR